MTMQQATESTNASAALDIQQAMDVCVDAQAMRAYLAPLLAPSGSVDAVRVLSSRRSASRQRNPNPLVVLYEVDLRESPQDSLHTIVLHGKIFRGGASAIAAQAGQSAEAQNARHARSGDLASDAPSTAAVHLPALDLLLYRWPYDPGLPQLPHLLDGAAALPHLGTAATSVRATRYQPGRRATLEYMASDGRALYAKTFDDNRGELIHRRFVHFWAAAESDRAAPTVAQPLAYSTVDRTLWQRGATGVPLRRWLEGDSKNGPWHDVARALAAIHDAPASLAGPRPRDLAHWLKEIDRRRAKIGRVAPALGARADAVAATLVAAAAYLPAWQPCVIHGDFHPDQVWIDEGRVVLFDFDEFTLGDPMEDLAEFLVKLPNDEVGRQAARQCMSAYARIAPKHFGAARLAWHRAVQLLLQASRAFVFQAADWRSAIEQRLDDAADCAADVARCTDEAGFVRCADAAGPSASARGRTPLAQAPRQP